MYTIAIQPDDVPLASGRRQSFSHRWVELSRASGYNIRIVDVYDEEHLFSQLQGSDAFMWAFWNASTSRELGKRMMSALYHTGNLITFPNWRTCWFFEDKISQRYLLEARGIPTPKTWVFWRRQDAIDFLGHSKYPIVLKLAFGICSDNVCLLRNFEDGEYWVSKLFKEGVASLKIPNPRPLLREIAARGRDAAKALLGMDARSYSLPPDIQRGCVLFQEFIPGNDHDLRIVVIGYRAFAFRRMNRPGDFRASGSGLIDWNPQEINEASIHLALSIAKKLGQQVITFDIVHRNHEPYVVEVSYYYEAWTVFECPGHWTLKEHTSTNTLQWIEGKTKPEDAIFIDLLNEIEENRSAKSVGDQGSG
ncbi:ATP-grasp domain-containing protein [Candidatus Nitrospira salsa]|nr:MAG: hypothetical protein NPIRA01_17450 [Nitrospirales bacterium]